MKTYPVPPDYCWKLKISSYDVGPDRRLRLSNQLRLQQEAGELHFQEGGLGFNELVKLGMTFVITRLRTRIHRAPVLGEEVDLTTWHRNTKGAQFFRAYEFRAASGELLVESVSAFAVVDPSTHRLLRPTVFTSLGVGEQPGRSGSCPDPVKLSLPEGMTPAHSHRVGWSDLDYNGHLNNAVYADILCDSAPGGMTGKRLTEVEIAYLHEGLEGETIALKTLLTPGGDGGGFWVAGTHERGRCFEARALYADAPAAVTEPPAVFAQ